MSCQPDANLLTRWSAAAGTLRELAGTVHDVSSAAARRLLELAKAQIAARAGLADGLAGSDVGDHEEAMMAEVGVADRGG